MTGNKRQVHVSSFCFVPCWLYFDFSFFLSEQFRSKFMMYISKEHFSPCKIQVREKRKLHKACSRARQFPACTSKNYQNKHGRRQILKIGMKIFYENKQAQKCLNIAERTGDNGRKAQIHIGGMRQY